MRCVLLDANLIVLWVVGKVDPRLIAEHKKLSTYRLQDWGMLVDILDTYDQIVVTPNVLTEASNLVRSGVKQPKRQAEFSELFANLVFTSEERFRESALAVQDRQFNLLGLADVASVLAVDQDVTILTADAGLYIAALNRGLKATNFNHLRDIR